MGRNGAGLFIRLSTRSGCLLGLLLSCVGLLGGCTVLLPADRGQSLAVEFEQVLPAGWEPLGRWRTVNLDEDEDVENFLLFRFEGVQIGALIHDEQPASGPDQSYRILPRYFDEQGALGQGVIAPPGSSADLITLHAVDGDLPHRELLIRGGNTHLTFVWWKGQTHGYGVTQLYAPGGFGGIDWEAWQQTPAPIQTVIGYWPLQDYLARSHICRTQLHIRRTDLPSELPTIIFSTSRQGLHFCGGTIPDHPFAPEGVVLAYLLGPRSAAGELDALLTPGTSLPQLDAESAFERLAIEQIEDIAAYPPVSMSYAQVQSAQTLTTPVCVEFAEVANPSVRRWVVFTLRYQPPDETQRLPERWTLSGALPEPPPMERAPSGYCAIILSRNAP